MEASYIEEQTAALISELETFLKSSSKPLARAVMAKLVTMVPLFIRDYNQLEEYIQNSLSSCSDVAEKLAQFHLFYLLLILNLLSCFYCLLSQIFDSNKGKKPLYCNY